MRGLRSFCLVSVLLLQGGNANKSCSTMNLSRHLGSFGIDLSRDSVPNGTKGTLKCDETSKPGSIITFRLWPDEATIECIDGQWDPPSLFYCFRGCSANTLRRLVGNWTFNPAPSRPDFFDHGSKARLHCPSTHFLATRDRSVLKKRKIQPPNFCINGRWFPEMYCWDKELQAPFEITVSNEVKEFWAYLKKKVLEERLKKLEEPEGATEPPTPSTTVDQDMKGASCYTYGLSRLSGSFGINMSTDTVPHRTKGKLVCKNGSKPGASTTARLVADSSIECIDGTWRPTVSYQCFRSCSIDQLGRAVGNWTFAPDWSEMGLYDHGTEATLHCPESHYVACKNRRLAEARTVSYCISGEWFPQLYCWENGTEPEQDHNPFDPIATAKILRNRLKKYKEQGKRFSEDELNVEFVATNATIVKACQSHSDCYFTQHAPKEFVCDWDPLKHQWAAGVKLPWQPTGCFCDIVGDDYTVIGSNKCVITRIVALDKLQWAFCLGGFVDKCVD